LKPLEAVAIHAWSAYPSVYGTEQYNVEGEERSDGDRVYRRPREDDRVVPSADGSTRSSAAVGKGPHGKKILADPRMECPMGLL